MRSPTATRYVALPAQHVPASRLAWKIARALAARERGWSLTNLAVSRRWRLRVGASSWVAQAYASFFFDEPSPRLQGLVCTIDFKGKGSASATNRSSVVRDLRSRLGKSYTESHNRLMRGVRGETRPRALLAELDRIARAFGSDDRHPSPRTRARTPGARLWAIGEAVLAHGTWSLKTPGMRLPPRASAYASISPMPASWRDRPELSSLLFIGEAKARSGTAELISRAEAHGYPEHAGKRHPDVVLTKLQALSLRAALAEAKFLEAEMDRFSRG